MRTAAFPGLSDSDRAEGTARGRRGGELGVGTGCGHGPERLHYKERLNSALRAGLWVRGGAVRSRGCPCRLRMLYDSLPAARTAGLRSQPGPELRRGAGSLVSPCAPGPPSPSAAFWSPGLQGRAPFGCDAAWVGGLRGRAGRGAQLALYPFVAGT